MNEAIPYILFIIMVIVGIIATMAYENRAKENVKDELERKGCQEIEVSRTFLFGRREVSYDVKYRNKKGEWVANSCVVTGTFVPGDIYWKNPI